jgi:hypothetical protein
LPHSHFLLLDPAAYAVIVTLVLIEVKQSLLPSCRATSRNVIERSFRGEAQPPISPNEQQSTGLPAARDA